MFLSILLFVGSLVVLIYASNRFIDSAEQIGLSFGISPFIIGVTIIAFGTSLPELATSVASVLSGSSEIVVGNVVGSNITNLLLVLGVTTLASGQLRFTRNVAEDDLSLLLGSTIFLYFVLSDYNFSRMEMILFFLGLITFLIYSIRDDQEGKNNEVKTGLMTYVTLILSGTAIYLGAKYTVVAIETISTALEINASLVSLSVLALGTSLPEIVVCVAATRRGLHSMALGNIIGSNIFNTYGVMAVPSLFGTLVIPHEIMSFSMPFLIAVTVLFGMVVFSKKVSKWEALLLLLFYVFYLTEIIKSGFWS